MIKSVAFESFDEASKYLYGQASSASLIGIDGWTGSGKSTLGRKLAARFDRAWPLDLDSFLSPIEGQFFAALELDSLKAAIEATSSPLVVSGVCMMQVLGHIGLAARPLIYLKRLNAGIWADEDEAIGNALETYENAGIEPSILLDELKDYHSAFRPHLSADFVIEISDQR